MANNIENIRKRAKSLSVISMGIILYLVAGGKFTDKGAFMGGSIKFNHPEMLEYAVVIAFFYFLFRYYLANKNNWENFKKELYQRLSRRREFIDYADDLADDYVKKLVDEEINIVNRSWHDKKEEYYPTHIN